MTLFRFFTFVPLAALLACSCTHSRFPRDVKASVLSIQSYANSFRGLAVEEVRSRLQGIRVAEGTWKEAGVGGRELVAKFPDYELRILFFEEKAITASVQILSR